jgi:hypothetical protein
MIIMTTLLHSTLVFFLKIYFRYFLFNEVKYWQRASSLRYLTLKQRDHGAAAPSPQPLIMPKHDDYLGGIGKKKLVDGWGQCALI